MIVLFYFFTCFNSSRALWILAYAQTSPISFVHVAASIWARKTCVPLWLLFWSCLQDYTKWNWQDNNELFCLYLCVCVYISQKKWQKFFKCKSLKDSKRQDLKRLDWCLSFQIVVPIASTKNGSNVLRLKYLRCSVSWVFKWAWAHMGSSALPGWPHYQRYLAFCPVLREVSEPRMTAMARTSWRLFWNSACVFIYLQFTLFIYLLLNIII